MIGLTTSDWCDGGHSQNILNAFRAAQEKDAYTIGFFSSKTRKLLNVVDVALVIPDTRTALTQEGHLSIIHLLCEQIEKAL